MPFLIKFGDNNVLPLLWQSNHKESSKFVEYFTVKESKHCKMPPVFYINMYLKHLMSISFLRAPREADSKVYREDTFKIFSSERLEVVLCQTLISFYVHCWSLQGIKTQIVSK